jgi:uncharacterized membrane protein
MDFLHTLTNIITPIIVFILEWMGIFVIAWTCIKAFWEYIQNTFMKRHIKIQTHLAKGLATGLEFKLGAEILKTVTVHDIDELIVLGAVFGLRALMSILIHFELKHTDKDDD